MLLTTDWVVKRTNKPDVVVAIPDCEVANVQPVDSDATYKRISDLLTGLPERWPGHSIFDGESVRLGENPPGYCPVDAFFFPL